jgi:hypothetical protein
LSVLWEVNDRDDQNKWLASFYTKSKAISFAQDYLEENPGSTLLIRQLLGRIWFDKDNKLCADGVVPDLLKV